MNDELETWICGLCSNICFYKGLIFVNALMCERTYKHSNHYTLHVLWNVQCTIGLRSLLFHSNKYAHKWMLWNATYTKCIKIFSTHSFGNVKRMTLGTRHTPKIKQDWNEIRSYWTHYQLDSIKRHFSFSIEIVRLKFSKKCVCVHCIHLFSF